MAESYDVIIIGAGPAGIFTALELADTGASVLIIEKGLDIRETEPHRRKKDGKISFAAGAAPVHFPTENSR